MGMLPCVLLLVTPHPKGWSRPRPQRSPTSPAGRDHLSDGWADKPCRAPHDLGRTLNENGYLPRVFKGTRHHGNTKLVGLRHEQPPQSGSDAGMFIPDAPEFDLSHLEAFHSDFRGLSLL